MFFSVVFAAIGTAVVDLLLVTTRATNENDVINRAAERTRIALRKVERSLRSSLADTVDIQNTGSVLVFTLPDGYDGAAVIPGDSIRYTFALAQGESNNGADDNLNGLVDEGQLVRENLTTGESFSICSDLDLNESLFALNGGSVVVTVVSQGFVPSRGATYELTRSVTVTPRN